MTGALHALAAAVLLCTAGCKSSQPCMSPPEMNDLLTQAALVRVDVYDAMQAQCADNFVVAQGAPLLSRTFPGGTPVRLDIPPGSRTIVMTTFGDAEGKTPTGSACSQSDLSGGVGACLSLTLISIDAGACSPTDDSCPSGQFCGSGFSCESGCKTGADCTMAGKSKCDSVRHQCVECAGTGDCSPGQVCSPAGACTETCDGSTPCSGSKSCCAGLCVDTLADPLNCNGCGMPCTGGNTLCCNGQCANPSTSTTHCGMCGNTCSTFNGTPTCSSGVCNWTCKVNFVHCGTGNTGCETASNNVTNCGGCGNVCTPTNASANMCVNATACGYTCQSGFLDCVKVGANTDGCESSSHAITSCGGCNNVCDTTHSMGAACPAATCTYTGCVAGFEDCSATAPNTNGCESVIATHMNGLGNNYVLSCVPLGTPGNAATYTVAMANAAATAWTMATDAGPTAKTCTGNASCVQRTSATECAVWCYTKMGVAGYVVKSAVATCSCPTSADSPWN